MHLSAKSYQLRAAARAALAEGEYQRALPLARRAQELCPTLPGQRLYQASTLLSELAACQRSHPQGRSKSS